MTAWTTCVVFCILMKYNLFISSFVPERRGKVEYKYILLWTTPKFSPFSKLGQGRSVFIENNCSVTNCVVLAKRQFYSRHSNILLFPRLPENKLITWFDAIAFNGHDLNSLNRSQLPSPREPHQKFIFYNWKSADYYPICPSWTDDFFNWTATYKLDSDIVNPYFKIKNKLGVTVGPKSNMKWRYKKEPYSVELVETKTKAVAWFVSKCKTRNNRMKFVKKLQKALNKYNLKIDIYGKCGPMLCSESLECDRMLSRDYYFYIAAESSFAVDYVTGTLLRAFQNDVVPIVFGGANYSRFLPPGSYIDAAEHSKRKIAALIDQAMKSPKLYFKYFLWRNAYSYYNAESENICSLCEALNDESLAQTNSRHLNFRAWWNPNYRKRCKGKT